MKKTIRIVLIFVAVLAALLGIAALIQRAAGPRAASEEAGTRDNAPAYNEYDEAGAAEIVLEGDTASSRGLGVRVEGSVVTVRYPGTYRVRGTLTDGQLAVDLGDFDGAVYLLLDGASVTNSNGPALYVAQCGRTTLRLAEGTGNTLADGGDYVITSGGQVHSGAAVYSADDLVIEGTGALTVTGNTADGIRVKDSLLITGGALNITGVDDGIQVNDDLTVTGGSLLIGASGDGVSVTAGGAAVTGGYLWINSAGDAMAAAGELRIDGGTVNATACGGSSMYSYIALNDLSAKGLKAETVTVTGGVIDLDAADDTIHAAGDVRITGGSFSLTSGDDAIHAGGTVDISGVSVDVVTCYEGLEGAAVRLANTGIRVVAQKTGVDAGADGFTADGGTLVLYAPCAAASEGVLNVAAGTVTAVTSGTESPLRFASASVAGSLSVSCSGVGAGTVLEGGELPASLLFVLPNDVPAGTAVTLWDSAGTVLFTTVSAADGGAYLYAGYPLVPGGTYTLTAGDTVYTAVLTEGCTVTPESALTEARAFGEPSGGPSGGN